MKTIKLLTITVLTALLFAGVATAQSVADRVAGLKGNVAASKAILRHYQWIETTTVSLNGDVKSTKEMLCYYGDDGSIVKAELSDEQAQSRHPHLFRRIKAAKKQELTDYMQSAVSLVKSYVPPRASLIQAAKDNGNVSMQLVEPGKRARVIFSNYLKQGDSYGVEIGLVTNRPIGLKVSTWLNDPSDTVTLDVAMGLLDNGAVYPLNITLNAPSQGLTVMVQNSGYRRN